MGRGNRTHLGGRCAQERVQKVMARAGVGSRRHCENLIREGRVRVDGVAATIGMTVDACRAQITVDGRALRQQGIEYWVLNKRAGSICTVKDPQSRPTVMDGLPTRTRVYPVGRLDWDSTGLVLMTNDGELALRLSHPRYGVEKEYRVRIRGEVSDHSLTVLQTGIQLDDGPTAPAIVTRVRRRPSESTLHITIREGRNRQVRRMLEALGHSILSLHRCRIGDLDDRGLAPGQYRELTSREVNRLRAAVGLPTTVPSHRKSVS